MTALLPHSFQLLVLFRMVFLEYGLPPARVDGRSTPRISPWIRHLRLMQASRTMEEDYYSGQRIHGYKVTDTIAAVNVCTEAVPDELFEPFIRNADGQLGCLFSFNTSTDGNNIILMLYNKDSGATSPFFCMVIDNLNNDTKTSASVSPSLCASGQTASAVPTSGFRLELSANETCKQTMVPLSTTPSTVSSGKGMFAFLHTIFFGLCVYCFIPILF
ncbi:hypothetical protein MAR_011793 [Mya arenaria]|uniref:Uncharacterized protein n=1 Tax=Mya arenaria TaxID=6604 RepID=A0ABY7FYT6_MYAAR|nr:hypothetical protein MAR_011793 [Mya arenaria]